MSNGLTIEMMDEVRTQAIQHGVELAKELISVNLGPNREAYGDTEMSVGQRIQRFIDDAKSGAVDILQAQSPAIYKEYVAQFTRDINDSPLVRGK